MTVPVARPLAARTRRRQTPRAAIAALVALLIGVGTRARPATTVPPGVQQRPVAVNRLAMQVTNCGSFASDRLFIVGGGGGLGVEFPRGTGKYVAFAGGLWFSGRAQGALRTAVCEYGTEFMPGPAVAGGPGLDTLRFAVYATARGDTTGTGEWMARGVPLGAPVDASGTRPGLVGDQTLWTVFTDAGVTSSELYGHAPRTPIGLEVQLMAYAFDRPPVLQDVVFLHYRIFHKGDEPLDDAFVGLWYDADIRTAAIPAGSDSSLDLGYVYRTSDDQEYGVAGPATGLCILRGPRDPGTGTALRVRSIVAWVNGADPSDPARREGVLHGLYPWGAPMVDSTTLQPTLFYASGDPVTGTGWLMPDRIDMKVALGMGPLAFAPGDTLELDAALVVGQGADRAGSVTALRANVREARAAFADGFRSLPEPRPAAVGKLIARPLPSAGAIVFDLVVPSGGGVVTIDIVDLTGRRVRRLDAGSMPGGVQHVAWDGTRDGGERARPGIYFARARAAGGESTARVVLIP